MKLQCIYNDEFATIGAALMALEDVTKEMPVDHNWIKSTFHFNQDKEMWEVKVETYR